ncbi:hypothetical protein IKQ21_09785 [bacterium]|nr:hypothetical protein [bacterium]
MQVSRISVSQNQKYNKQNNASFKSTFPVAYWVKDKGKWAPVTSLETVKELQRKLVTILNHELSSLKKNKSMQVGEQTLRTHISSKDVDYRLATENPKFEIDKKTQKLRRITPVRSFLNRVEQTTGNYDPISYLITGYAHIAEFNQKYAKQIGRDKGYAKDMIGIARSAASDEAVKFYNQNGMGFVEDPDNILRDARTRMPQVLHVAFEIPRDMYGNVIKDKNGKIKYIFDYGKFKDAYGPDCPFEKLKK